MTPRVDLWEESVGFLPWKVTVYENPERKRTLYLRWRQDGNWKKESLRRSLRTVRGAIDPTIKQWAKEQAEQKYARLVAGVPEEQRAPKAPLTIAQGLKAALDPQTGRYPTNTHHSREVKREMERAIAEWGGDTAWTEIKRAQLRKLWRHRILELRAADAEGLRGAEITVSRVLAVATWLRDEELIPTGACVASRKWKQELRADWIELTGERALPAPSRPRHTLEEMRKIMAVADRVDPRFELAMSLGAELRLGQVLRCRRPDVSLEHKTLTVRGKGQKRGTVVHLTDGQMRVLQHALTDGYLRELEAQLPDYPLFPAGQMPGIRVLQRGYPSTAKHASWRPPEVPTADPIRHGTAKAIDRSQIDGWFRKAEALAEVPHIEGRGAYGIRRAAVDAVKAAGISREALKEHGGWADTQMPDQIYADQEADYARDEARDVRAKIRGEE